MVEIGAKTKKANIEWRVEREQNAPLRWNFGMRVSCVYCTKCVQVSVLMFLWHWENGTSRRNDITIGGTK